MIKLKSEISDQNTVNELKKMLQNLENSIEELKKMEVGINISAKSSAMDLVLTADFDNANELDIYRVHPEHIKVLDFLKEVADFMKVVDYYI